MSKQLLDVVRDKIRYKHYSLQTEKATFHGFGVIFYVVDLLLAH